MPKTTQKQFERFIKTFKYWQEKFGMTNYRVFFEMGNIGDNYARIIIDEEKLVAKCIVSKQHSRNIEGTALHEALHLLLHPLHASAKDHYIPEITIDHFEKSIVNRLENIFGGVENG